MLIHLGSVVPPMIVLLCKVLVAPSDRTDCS